VEMNESCPSLQDIRQQWLSHLGLKKKLQVF